MVKKHSKEKTTIQYLLIFDIITPEFTFQVITFKSTILKVDTECWWTSRKRQAVQLTKIYCQWMTWKTVIHLPKALFQLLHRRVVVFQSTLEKSRALHLKLQAMNWDTAIEYAQLKFGWGIASYCPYGDNDSGQNSTGFKKQNKNNMVAC